MALLLLEACPGGWLVTPRVEIIRGFLEKLGVDCADWSEELVVAYAWLHHRITTPIRLRNRLASGSILDRPPYVILDEAHHDISDSWQELQTYLGRVPRVGLTATPFRGTPKSTAEFLKQWGDEITWILTLKQASEGGYLAVPTPSIWPLVDDDKIEVVNGDIHVKAAGAAVKGRIGEVVERCLPFVGGAEMWDRPTMFSVPTIEVAGLLATALNNAGLPAISVTQETSGKDRVAAFKATVACTAALVQIAVVSEGVDLPIRRLIDLAPTLSPVRWLQLCGRITRPTPAGEPPPEYICCCRNLARHCYLYEGLMPAKYIAVAQAAFPPSKREGMRAIGLEAVGKFKAAELPLRDGLKGSMYSITAMEGFKRTDYCVLLHPCNSEPVIASRSSTRAEDGTMAWGRWARCAELPELIGFASASNQPLTDKMSAWWKRSANNFGLDAEAKVTKKSFAALPVLADLRARLNSA